MPHWVIYHTPDTFTDPADRRAFVSSITSAYVAAGLPAFFVVVNFLPQAAADFWVGGVPVAADANSPSGSSSPRPYVRITIAHIAIHAEDAGASHARIAGWLDRIIDPHCAGRGWGYEYHAVETPRALWKIDGLIPPPHGSEEEKRWAEEGRAVEYPGAKL